MVLAFTAAAIAMLICLIPAGIVIARGDLPSAVVAYQFVTAVMVMVLALLAQASRPVRAVRAGGAARAADVRRRAGVCPGHGALVVTARDVGADVLLGLAVLIVAGASLGVLLMRDAYQKLHFVTPAALAAPVLVALA